MDFGWGDEQRNFRQRVAEFLEAHLPVNWDATAAKSPGSKEVTDFSLRFCPKLAAAGLLVPHWPIEYGGRLAPPWEHFLLGELMWRAGEPRGPQYYNVNWIGPTLMKFGGAEQKKFHLGLMSQGKVIWSQGFSEPSAGSDLAALRTRSERSGRGFVIHGSKIWTSYAALSNYCFLLVKAAAGKGISIFLLPMDRPGITVRAIESVVGTGDLHEIFFDDVEAHDDELLGEDGQGWEIARYALHLERVGIPRYALALRVLDSAVRALEAVDAFATQARDKAACAYAACEAARLLVYEVVDRRARNLPPDGSTSIARFSVVQAEQAVSNFVLDFRPSLLASSRDPLIETHHRRAITSGIAAGAAEIQLNLIARDVLGLGGRDEL